MKVASSEDFVEDEYTDQPEEYPTYQVPHPVHVKSTLKGRPQSIRSQPFKFRVPNIPHQKCPGNSNTRGLLKDRQRLRHLQREGAKAGENVFNKGPH
jgi:hypothetical protein